MPAIMTRSVTVWVSKGPRDQTNCINGWGKRTFTAATVEKAIELAIKTVGRFYYGGIDRN